MTSTSRPRPLADPDQARAWNGPEGEAWARHAEREPDRPTGLHEPLLAAAAIGAHDRVLDVGCGTGQATRLAARAAVDGHATGVDLSRPMIEQAREIAWEAGLANTTFMAADAQVHPFAPRSFDVAISHFGTMFFADPAAAFTNIARALRFDGRLVFVVPRSVLQVEWFTVPYSAVAGHSPEGDDVSRMFSLASADVVLPLLHGAGFDPVELTRLDRTMRFGPDALAAAEFYADSGPMRVLAERSPELTRDRLIEMLLPVLEPYADSDGVHIPGAHWLVEARRGRAPVA